MNKDTIAIWQKILKGIENGKRAYCGPYTVQLDLTDKCNNTCIGCWVHSPLLGKDITISPKKEEKVLSIEVVKRLLDELYRLGTKEVFLSGSGEPFMYPYINEVIKLIKSKGMYLNIITNGTFLSRDMSKLLIDNKVDLITVSMWAGTKDTYKITNPGRDEIGFNKLKKNLETIAYYKHSYNSVLPHIKIYNVICSVNYHEIETMIDFAKDIDADSVEFQIIDIIKGKNDSLALTPQHVKKIIAQFENLRRRKDIIFFSIPKDVPLEVFKKEEFFDLGKIWKNYKEGINVSRHCATLTCKKGYVIRDRRIIVSEDKECLVTHPEVFWYKFEYDGCKKCDAKTDCLSNDNTINVRLMNILGIGSFLRRIFSLNLEMGIYDKNIDTIPCYIGWYYTRILTNGDVIPCCKSSLHPLGNIYKESFSKIWNSHLYKEFRFKAKNLSKSDSYFSKINCVKSCDNYGMNVEVLRKIRDLEKETYITREKKEDIVVIPARDFVTGNFNAGNHSFGSNIIIDGGDKKGFAQYEFKIDKDGIFEFWSRYASGTVRPVDLYIDGKLAKRGGLSCVTGGWDVGFLRWYKEFETHLEKGKHILQISSPVCIPHIEKFTLVAKKHASKFLMEKERNISYISRLKHHIGKNGLMAILKDSVATYPRIFKDRYLEILGIYDGEYGYKGPFHVQIDLTNNCNNNCIACWCNSPLFKKPRFSPEEKKQYIPTPMVKELLDEVARMGATEVYFSGGGEPFMHPRIMEILKYTKKKNLICHINTNFTLLTKKQLDLLIDLNVDFLTVSLWAATPETYIMTHTNRTKEDFYKIKENLLYLNTHKKGKPNIKIYNVIFNMNYLEIEKMVEYAAATMSESLEFALVDTIPGATDKLALTEEQAMVVKNLCEKIKSNLDSENRMKGSGVLIFQFDQFLRRVSSFSNVAQAKYDREIIDSMPCYIGWLFARVVPNGEVHSCLKAHRIPTGSLYLNNFSEIWNSDKQKYFRKKTLVYKKSDPFFKLIGNDPYIQEAGCYKSCDDIGRNTWMHKRISMLSLPEKIVLKGITKSLKIARRLKPEKENYKKYHKDPLIAGIIHGRKAFAGPEQVVIDPTNRCNLRCISCWLYSPLLTRDKPSSTWLGKELSKDVLKKLIDDLSCLGVKRIRFTGGGEPFMHKELMEVIEYACKKSLLVGITTNFGLVSKEDIKRLVDLGIEELCISIWAATPGVYKQTHPETSSIYFEKLKENLSYLKEIKKYKPRVTFANVIMNTNFKEFEQMYEFGLRYGADALYFTVVDIFSGQTDKLLLSEEERKILIEKALEIRKRSQNDKICLEFFDGFLKRISISQEEFKKGEYDKVDIDKIPCYVGWIFSRILADGSVVPCCRGVKKIMGNVNEEPFKKIWFSAKYNEFRAKAKYLSKTDPYFKDIGCIKECDNLMHNEKMQRRLNEK